MELLGLIVTGLIIGIIARLVLPGRQRIGLPLTLVLGVLGAVISGMIVSALGTGRVFELDFLGVLIAIPCAAALIAGAQAIGIGEGDRRRDELQRPR